jgi:putative SOS response-associated peptidase YedK
MGARAVVRARSKPDHARSTPAPRRWHQSTFREPFERRRCLVVADGFYEWRAVGGARQPYYVRLRSRRPFAFAGIWDRWKPKDGAPLLSCAIVTCAPNALMAPIHDRMPVIVPAASRALWLARDAGAGDLGTVLRPYPEEAMEAYPVSKLVNAPRNEFRVHPAVGRPPVSRTGGYRAGIPP